MEMYDEDLTTNSFFKKLQVDSPVLYDVATRRRWLICVPRRGALGSCEFSDTDFENHILFQEEGHDDFHYFTVNKKELVIKCNVITTKTGFKEERIVPILFEETFFNKNDESYLVLCINQPLEGNTVYGSENRTQEGQIVLHHISDCADLLFRKNGNVKVGTALDDHMRTFLQAHANLETHVLDTLLKDTMTFYAKGLQIIMKDHTLKRRSQEEEGFYLTLKVALESYLMHNVYRHLFIHIGTCVALKDSRMNKITRNLRDLQLRDLDVRTEFCQNVPKARRELSNLCRYFTPLGKLICLKRVFRVLMQGGSASPAEESLHMSTDDLLPMVIFLIIKADEGHWWAIFTYITMFRFSKQDTDNEYGFFLATVEAALEHIASNQIHKYLLSRKVRELSVSYSSQSTVSLQETLWRQQEQAKSHLDSFFQCVFVGDLNALKEFLSQEPSPVADTSALCHPLCECDKCQKVITEKQQEKEEMKVSLDSYDDRGWTALHLAAWCGHVDIVDWLVQSGMDINIKDIQGHTPLHVACMAGQQSSTLLVLHLQADPNTQNNENNTALHLAALHGHEDCVKALAYYDQGSTALDTEIPNDFGDTALHFASRWGFLSICQILLENGAEVTPRNRKNMTPIDVSHNLVVMNLLQSRLRPHPNAPVVLKPQDRNLTYQKQRRRSSTHKEKTKVSPKIVTATISQSNTGKLLPKEKLSNPKIEKLLTAVLNRDLPLIDFYMGWTEGGDPVEIPSTSPVTEESLCHPLCQCDKCAPVQQLRSPTGKDIHINCQNAEGISPLHVAAQCGYLEICRVFVQRGALVNLATNTQGYTPLHLAVKHQRQEVVAFLLRHKCELDLTDARGNTALHHAAICGTDNILTTLLDYGGNKNLQNGKGNTALHESSAAGHVTCVRVLLEYGADVNIKNLKGLAAVQLSSSERVRGIFQYASLNSHIDSSVCRVSQGSSTSQQNSHAKRLCPSDTISGQRVTTDIHPDSAESSFLHSSIFTETAEHLTSPPEHVWSTSETRLCQDITSDEVPDDTYSKSAQRSTSRDKLLGGESVRDGVPEKQEFKPIINTRSQLQSTDNVETEDYVEYVTPDDRLFTGTMVKDGVAVISKDECGIYKSDRSLKPESSIDKVSTDKRSYPESVFSDTFKTDTVPSSYEQESRCREASLNQQTTTKSDKLETGVQSVGGNTPSDVSQKTEGTCTDQWTFIPLNDPSEQGITTDCDMGPHTDKTQSHYRPEDCRVHEDDGFVSILKAHGTGGQSQEEVASLFSGTESLGSLSFKEEYFANSSLDLMSSCSDADPTSDKSNTVVAGSGIKNQGLQTQALFAVEKESENSFSVDEDFVYRKKDIKSLNCDTLSEDSRTESEKDLSAE